MNSCKNCSCFQKIWMLSPSDYKAMKLLSCLLSERNFITLHAWEINFGGFFQLSHPPMNQLNQIICIIFGSTNICNGWASYAFSDSLDVLKWLSMLCYFHTSLNITCSVGILALKKLILVLTTLSFILIRIRQLNWHI